MARTAGAKRGMAGATPAAPTKPKAGRGTTPSADTLAALPQARLIALILGEAGRNPAFKKLVSAALAGLRGADAVAAMVDRRLSALEAARGYIGWQKRRTFAADLDATVTVILDELLPLDPQATLERLRRFLDGAGGVLDRVDDSNGTTQAVYDRAGEALVGIVAGLPMDQAGRFTASLLPRFLADPYAPLGGILHDLVETLPAEAVVDLDDAVAQAVADLPRREVPEGHRFDATRNRVLRLQQALADRRGDVDAFVAIEDMITHGRPDHVPIARRLLRAGRAVEALDWIRRSGRHGIRAVTRGDLIAGIDPDAPDRERRGLEIEILDALDRMGEAQGLRWSCFADTLDAPMLRDFLARLPDFEDEEALSRALDLADAFAEPHRALAFLLMWPDLARAARLVVARADAWEGERYPLLAPGAEALSADHPLAATILYRALVDRILGAGRSAAYGHAARYVAELDGLAPRLVPGTIAPDPGAYRDALRRDHGRKYGFWTLLDAD